MGSFGALIIGAAVGLAIVVPLLWSYRSEIRQSWSEALGRTGPNPAPTPEMWSEASRSSATRFEVPLAIILVAFAGSALAALVTSDATVRAVNVLLCLILASAALLLIRSRRSGGPGT